LFLLVLPQLLSMQSSEARFLHSGRYACYSLLAGCLSYPPNLKMEGAHSFEVSKLHPVSLQVLPRKPQI
jgi:hypothetical protein